jgi:hypothetical protein
MSTNYRLYIVEHMASGRVYVGQTMNPHARPFTHLRKSCNAHLRRAVEKYGREAFDVRVLPRAYGTKEEIDAAEVAMITDYRAIGDCVYNISVGGERGNLEAMYHTLWTNRFLGLSDPVAAKKKADATMGHEGRCAATRKANETMGPERRAARSRKAKQTMGPERRSDAVRKGREAMGPERRAVAAERAKETYNPEKRAAASKKMLATLGPVGLSNRATTREASMSPEVKSARAEKIWQARRDWQVLGFNSRAEANAWLADYRARFAVTSSMKEIAHV